LAARRAADLPTIFGALHGRCVASAAQDGSLSSPQQPDESTSPSAQDDAGALAPVDFSDAATLPFLVVGIGASAGGLDPLRVFFEAAPVDAGIAWVVVQHLPPERESLMADILGRHTAMPVRQIDEGMTIEPDTVYVIRPGFTVTMPGGVFALGAPVEQRGHRRPVDDFFRSLAEVQKEKSVAVVLSGMGTNGTSGAQAIKAAGGLCIAQDPETAEFPSMPSSLIHAGYADQALRPAEMPAVLASYARQPYLDPEHAGRKNAERVVARELQHLQDVLALIQRRTGRDFTGYRRPTVLRRIQRRMGLLSMQRLQEYAEHLRGHGDEVVSLANDLMINVTGFFRDPQAWDALRMSALRPLIAEKNENSSIRAWVTACSSGEEAYTLAILLADEADRAGKHVDIKIFATDTAEKSLGLARTGVFPGGIESDVPLDLLDRYFDKDEHTYRVKKQVREMVVFASHDVLRDPPFSRIDLCTCRNLLIYLEPEMQRRVLAMIHFALRDGGYLFLGNSETLGPADGSFEAVSKKWRIYTRLAHSARHSLEFSTSPTRQLAEARRGEGPVAMRPAPAQALQQALLEEFAPPTVVVDRRERIVYYHGDMTAYLAHPSGEPTYDLYELLRPVFQPLVRDALRRARNEKQTVVAGGSEPASTLRVTAAPLLSGRQTDYFRITFETGTAERHSAEVVTLRPKARVRQQPTADPVQDDLELASELRLIRRELQQTIEAYEVSNEELKASNEEVLSINEELQSANEELETSKEELQSLNEELLTVNGQLQAKIHEIEQTTNDLANLLSSTDIAVLFLDPQLRVRRYTPAVQDLVDLIPADIGRPVVHLAQKFEGGDLVVDAKTVLARLVPQEGEIRSDSGTWYLRRTLPYRTADDRIDGIVVTFVDITARKLAEQALATSQARLQATMEQMPAAMILVEPGTGKLMYGNRKASELFGLGFPMPLVGSEWTNLVGSLKTCHADGRPYRLDEWPLARTVARGETVVDEEIELERADGQQKTLLAGSAPVRTGADGPVLACVAAFWDITARRRAATKLHESEDRLRLLIESAVDYAIFTTGPDGRITSWNTGAERLLGWTESEALGMPGAKIFTPEDRATGQPEREMRTAVEQGCAADERFHIRKDGSRFWASGSLTALPGADGKVRGFAKIMRDHTERREAQKRIEDALRSSEALRAAAEQANRAKDEFISTVSHELRTPLNTIRLWSKMLGSGKVPHENWGDGIRSVERAAITQQQLIDDLLDVSRMATGKLRLNIQPTRLQDAIDGAVEAVRPMATARGVQLDAHLDEKIGVVRGDPERVQQVLWNLLANAIKFTPEGGQIDLTAVRAGDVVELRVTDTGIGIRPEFLPYVFERFRQAEAITMRTHTGLGLGLAIAKQLVELHGGTITAASEGEGRGAVFTVRLPMPRLRKPLDDSASVAADPEQARFDGLRVLLVEDDPATREATQRLLEMHGVQVSVAESAQVAHDTYAVDRPKLLICDIGLPGEDGFSLVRRLRQLEADQDLPRVGALALTAFAREEDQKHALDAGFDRHLPKPIDPDVLLTTIAEMVAMPGSAGET
jgi:two-component system CheB/CheR fusion protein